MSGDHLPVRLIKIKKDGKLVNDGLSNQIIEDTYLKFLKEGERVEIMMEKVTMDSTHAQNNYFHKLCRVIADETGQPLEDTTTDKGVIIGVKSMVKIKAGLWASKHELKSAADFTKAEYSAVIQSAITLGEELGINLYNYGHDS